MTLVAKLTIAYAYCAFLTGPIVSSGLVYGLHWLNPCKPSLIGYWLLQECSGGQQIMNHGSTYLSPPVS